MAKAKAKAVKAVKTTKAKRAPAFLFDPAKVTVMGYKIESFNIGRRRFHRTFTEIDGVGAAAVAISEKDVALYRKAGHQIAYVASELCIVTTDLSFVKKLTSNGFESDELAKMMAFYGAYVGKPLLHAVHEEEFKHVSGTPYDLYAGCDDAADFDKIDATVVREYTQILRSNAGAAKSPQEVPPLFIENAECRTTEEAIVHFAWTAQEHQKRADAAYKEAIRRSNIFKAKQGLEKVDHYHPAYRAFTAPVFDLYIEHREHAKRARSLMRQVTETYIGKLEDERDSIPF